VDVRCDRCGRLHALDEAALTDAGIVVRCVGCGQAFRVRRRELVTTEPVAADAAGDAQALQPRNWLIRKRDGHVIAFQDLATLQLWVSQGRVTREDEISRSGGIWRRMSAIPEFQGLFEHLSVEAPAMPFQPTVPFEASPVAEPPPPRRSTKPLHVRSDLGAPRVPGAEASLGDAPQPNSIDLTFHESFSLESSPIPASPAWAEPAEPDRPRRDPLARTWEDLGVRHLSVASASPDDEVPVSRSQRRRPWRLVAILGAAAVVLAAVGLYVFQRPLLKRLFGLEEQPPPSAAQDPGYARGAEALRRDDLAGAEAELVQVLRRDPQNALALATLADVYATWADYLAELGDAPGAREKGKLALQRAEEANRLEPRLPLARVALANALRVAGRRVEAEKAIAGLAPATNGGALLEFVRGALAAVDPNQWQAAEAHLRASLARDSTFLRAHVKLARLAQEKRDYAAARRHLDAVIAASPGHPFARKILRNVPADRAPAAAPPLAPEPPPAPATPAALPPAPRPAAAKPALPRKPTALNLLRMADRLRERNPRKALKLYDEVLAAGRSGPALRGKGWAYLELGEFTLAARAFEQALRSGTGGDAYIGLGTAYRRLNQREKAREQFRKYLDLYPDGEESPVARTNLESLK
jgi:tetratricopeptide (TPR) repeat protein